MRGKENSNIIITIVVAAVTVISISLYECWWMRNLFNTTYESMELGISSSMALAELSSDKTVSLYLKYDVDSVRDTTPYRPKALLFGRAFIISTKRRTTLWMPSCMTVCLQRD